MFRIENYLHKALPEGLTLYFNYCTKKYLCQHTPNPAITLLSSVPKNVTRNLSDFIFELNTEHVTILHMEMIIFLLYALFVFSAPVLIFGIMIYLFTKLPKIAKIIIPIVLIVAGTIYLVIPKKSGVVTRPAGEICRSTNYCIGLPAFSFGGCLGKAFNETTICTPDPSWPVTMKFVAPRSTTEWQSGKTYTVHWTGGGTNIGLFLIDQSLESTGASVSISDRITPLDNTGSYAYTISPEIKPGTYKWCISDLSDTTTEQTCSEYFSIVTARE